MLGRFFQSCLRLVDLLVVSPAGDFVILDSKVAANAGLMQVGPKIFEVQVETDIAIEFAILIIPGVTFNGAPYLLARFRVAGQSGHTTRGTDDGRVNAEPGSRLGKQDAVGVRKEIADAGFFQKLLHPRDITALRQPDSLRSLAEVAGEFPRPNFNLSAEAVSLVTHERKETMRRRAGDDFQFPRFKKSPKAMKQVVSILIDKHFSCPQEAVVIHVGEVIELRLPPGSLDFLAGQ